jgi:FtsH-binding integral membrane protein
MNETGGKTFTTIVGWVAAVAAMLSASMVLALVALVAGFILWHHFRDRKMGGALMIASVLSVVLAYAIGFLLVYVMSVS